MRLAAALALNAGAAQADIRAPAATVVNATLTLPTQRYDHGVPGDGIEWGGLDLLLASCPEPCAGAAPARRLRIVLPKNPVFEGVTARLADLDGDGTAAVAVVETDLAPGASRAVHGAGGKIAAPSLHRPAAPLACPGLPLKAGRGRPNWPGFRPSSAVRPSS